MTTVFETDKLLIRVNQCDEVFVTNKTTLSKEEYSPKTELRISTAGADCLVLTADNARFNPTSFNGLGGFRITK